MIIDPELADVKKHNDKVDNILKDKTSDPVTYDDITGKRKVTDKVHFADFAKDYHGPSGHPSGDLEEIIFIQEVQSDLGQWPRKGDDVDKYRKKVDPTYSELTAVGRAMKHAGVTQEEYKLAFQKWDTPEHDAARKTVYNKIEKFLDTAKELSGIYGKERRTLRYKVITDMKTRKDLIKLKDEVIDLYKIRINKLIDQKNVRQKKELDDLFKILDDDLSDEFFDKLTAGDQKMMLINTISKFPLKSINSAIIPEKDLARIDHKQNLILHLRKNADSIRRTLPDDVDLVPVTPLVKDNAWVRHAIKNVIGKMVKGDKDRAVFASGEGQLVEYSQMGPDEVFYESFEDMLTDKDAPTGLVEFYNKILVQEARKVLKQIDPDAVEVIEIKDKIIFHTTQEEQIITKHHLTIKNTPKIRAFLEGAEGTPEGWSSFNKGGVVRQGKFDGGKMLEGLKSLGNVITDIKTAPKFKSAEAFKIPNNFSTGGKVLGALTNTRR